MFPYYILFLSPDGIPQYITGPWSETDVSLEFYLMADTKLSGTLIMLSITQGVHATIPFVDVTPIAWRWTGESEDDSRGT